MAAPLLLTDKLPLRRASDLPNYRTDAADKLLPWVFGRATLAPVPLDLVGAEWLVADHPIISIDRVTVAGRRTAGWQLVQRLDATGHPIAVLRLAQPTITDPVVVTLSGRRHPDTGAALASPPAIVRELMRLCGHTQTVDAWSGLEAAYGRTEMGLVLAADTTLREALASVLEPLGAMWRPGWAEPRTVGAPAAVLNQRSVGSITARADTTGLATVARVTYQYDWAASAARGSLELAAPDAVTRWGRLPVDMALPAVRRAKDALEIATTRLADLARVAWVVDATVDAAHTGALAAGLTVQIEHPLAPAGLALLTSVVHDREAGQYTIKAAMHATAAPRIELLRRQVAADAAVAGVTDVVYRDGVATFVILDDQGQPLAGATVQLDGQITANTNSAGQVQFRTTRGAHTLTVTAQGFEPFEMDVTV